MEVISPAITGDIILISQPQKNINLIMQSVLRLKKARHSHVAVALYGSILIHAMPRIGVHVLPLGEYLNQNQSFVVFRHKLALREDKSEALEKHLRFHNLQSYSLFNMIFTSWRSSFCSELAAKAYQKSEIRLTKGDRKPKKVLPIDIYDHVSFDPEWHEVTDEYRAFFVNGEHSNLMAKMANIHQNLVELNQRMGFGQQIFTDMLNAAGARQGEEKSPITPPMVFWSNRFAKHSKLRLVLAYWRKMTKEVIQHLWHLIKRRK
ncbi:YiiX/YebB-like N1pC/P60 family cysteine hydrolase [Pseudomonas sp. LF242]